MSRNILSRLGRMVKNTRMMDMRVMYRYWERDYLRRFFNTYDIDCVIDVGANYGQYAQMLRKKVGFKGLIVSIEPIPDAAARLRELSSSDPLWVVCEQALSSENGEQELNIMHVSQYSSLSRPRHDDIEQFRDENQVQNTVSVKTETLTSFFERLRSEHDIRSPFLKLDTQGYDVMILEHSKEILDQFIGLQSELAVKRLYEQSVDYREALTRYEEFGFVLSAFVPNNAGHFPVLVETDCIMLNKNYIT
ncbi:MAG: FkbM family methyltransferase [Gammaproteobacteria bacterium]|nr:FkbM family methyltransferase [Gammaproteobacteria bacterium]